MTSEPTGHSRHLFGRPLRRRDLEHQVLAKRYALPVFASDNLSSVAYATEEILIVLAGAGIAYYGRSLWIAALIMLGYGIVLISYRQTVFAYQNGGGAYIVARDNLGEGPAQIAGASLLVDYVLTVSVSIAAGVANLSSGIHQFVPAIPEFDSTARVAASLLLLGAMWYVNKRGVRESGRAFSVPTYFFLGSVFLMLAVGAVQAFTGHLGRVEDVSGVIDASRDMGLLLMLRAFASGSTAVTGVEAISNGITAFEEPKPRNAATTMAIMGILVAVMFLGITKLALLTDARASETETIISQLGRTIFSAHSPFYVAVIFGTAAILVMAANTSFADFPRLAALQAADGFLPRWMLDRDNRLVFGVGITVLSAAAGVLLIAFQASVTNLIPLYAVGVFLSVTLSQAGMTVHWLRVGRLRPGEHQERRSPEGQVVTVLEATRGWRWRLALSAFGASMTGIVTATFAIAKFQEGAWVIIILIPSLLWVLFRIHAHYRHVRATMALPEPATTQRLLDAPDHTLNLLVIGGLQRHALPAIRHLQHLGPGGGRRLALHVGTDEHDVTELRHAWNEHGLEQRGLALKVLPSEYGGGDVVGVLVSYVRGALAADPELRVSIVIPDWAANARWWGWLLTPALHHMTAARMRLAFNAEDRVTITNYRHLLRAEAPLVRAPHAD